MIPPTLESSARGDLHTRGSGLRRLEDLVPKMFVLRTWVLTGLFCQWMTTFRSRCEKIIPVFTTELSRFSDKISQKNHGTISWRCPAPPPLDDEAGNSF